MRLIVVVVVDSDSDSDSGLSLSSRRLCRCFHVKLWLRPPSKSTSYIYI